MLVRLEEETGDISTIEVSWKNFGSIAEDGRLEVITGLLRSLFPSIIELMTCFHEFFKYEICELFHQYFLVEKEQICYWSKKAFFFLSCEHLHITYYLEQVNNYEIAVNFFSYQP